jgi:ribonuclease PH
MIGAFGRRLPAALDGRFQAFQEFLARFATVQVGLNLFTREVIQLAVKIIRETCKYLTAAS